MEIKATLQKPFTDEQRVNFIVEQNHNNGYEIRETENEMQAWGYTQAEQEQKEQERIAQLSLTKREVFLALYSDKGITPEQIRSQLTDEAALIEFDYAERYYRGNVLIDLIGQRLGYTKQQLDNLFENGSF